MRVKCRCKAWKYCDHPTCSHKVEHEHNDSCGVLCDLPDGIPGATCLTPIPRNAAKLRHLRRARARTAAAMESDIDDLMDSMRSEAESSCGWR